MSELTILLIGLFILLTISFLFSNFDFFSPSFIICAIFVISAFLALRAVAAWGVRESIFSMKATFIILSGVFVFIVFERIAWIFSRKKIIEKHGSMKPAAVVVSKRKMFLIGIFCIFTTIVYSLAVYKYVRLNGYTGGFEFSRIGHFYHELTFLDETRGGISRSIRYMSLGVRAVMFVSIYILLHNIILSDEKVIKNVKFLLPAICWLPITIFTSSRMIYLRLLGYSVLIAYIMINQKDCWKRKRKNFKKIIKIGTLVFVVTLILFYLAVVNGLIGRQTNKTFLDYITIYLGAPIIQFNQFITDPPKDVIYFGQETFAGINSLLIKLGLRDVQYSVQLEPRNIVGIYNGNIYTFFRRPLHDFGLFGMYIVTALVSYIFSFVYYRNVYKRYGSYKNDRTLIIYGYFFYIIYLIPMMNNLCNDVSTATVFFVIAVLFVYAFMTGHLKIIRRRRI